MSWMISRMLWRISHGTYRLRYCYLDIEKSYALREYAFAIGRTYCREPHV